MYYPSSENKGADQLRGYREADLRLCFRKCRNPVFSRRGSIYFYHSMLDLFQIYNYLQMQSLVKLDIDLRSPTSFAFLIVAFLK